MKYGSLPALIVGAGLILVGVQVDLAQSTNVGSASAADQNSASKAHDENYVIGNEDVLAISVWKEPELTKSIPVRSDGKISLPLVGELQATGKTPLQLEQDITQKLKSFITAPEVNVTVEKVNSKKFNILGEINKPGSYPLTATTTIMDAIATAGGLRDFAKKSGIYVLRKTSQGKEEHLKFNFKDFIKGKGSDQNITLQPDDTVIVP
jgi:polysaccharide biosynthesis/export protein